MPEGSASGFLAGRMAGLGWWAVFVFKDQKREQSGGKGQLF
jgi:hypothetical protein